MRAGVSGDIITSERSVRVREGTMYMRRKRRERLGSELHAVVFVHGATYPLEATFDLSVDGLSWMTDLAHTGFDVYAFDLIGYGRSSRPAASCLRPWVIIRPCSGLRKRR